MTKKFLITLGLMSFSVQGMTNDYFNSLYFSPTFCCLTRDSDDSKVSKIKYVEKLILGKNMTFDIPSDKGKKLCSCCAQRAKQDLFKNHAFVQLYCSSVEKQSITACCWYNCSTSPDVITDWASHQSQLKSTQRVKVLHSDIGIGHSEQMIIKHIEDDFHRGQFVSKFQKLFDTMKQDRAKKQYIIGLNIYSSFDMCDECKKEMVSFFNQHKTGQTSIFQAVKDNCISANIDVEKFIITFQSQYPYKDAQYSLHANTDLLPDNKLVYSYNFSCGREDQFRVDLKDSYGDIYLTQQTSTLVKSGIYGYIYELGNSMILYDNKYFTYKHKY